MSDPIDIKALDEYLKGGSDISQRYRELGGDDVPPELDRRVLDEARAAVASGGGGRSRSWLRWGAPLALAASVVLVVTVVIESGVQNDSSFLTQPVDKAQPKPERQADEYDRMVEQYKLQEQAAQPPQQEPQAQFVPEAPALTVSSPVPAASPPPATRLLKAEAERSNAVAREELRADAKAVRDQSLAASSLDSPAPQLAAEQPAPAVAGAVAESSDDGLTSVSGTGTRARRAGRTAGPRNTMSNSALISETRPAADEDAERVDPQKWLEEIRELRRAGKVAEADLAWQDFRKAYPQFPVADDDLARKK